MKTRSRFYPILAIALLLLAFIATVTSAKVNEPKNVILISWDGVQRDHLNELLDDGKLPNLKALSEEGAMIPIEITTHKTDTKAGHTQMLTGYTPEVTGVYSNVRYGPIPEGLSLFERLEDYYGKDNVVTIALTGKTDHIGSLPAGKRPEGRVLRAAGKRQGKMKGPRREIIDCPAEPWNLVKNHMDVWDGDKGRNASKVGPQALNYLDEYGKKRFFFFLHFSDPDSKGHAFGENSDEYSNAIITCDTWLGEIRNRLKELGIDQNTLIYVTSDHGFDEGKKTHGNAPYVWLATNDSDLIAKEGDQMDIAPTILERLGIDVAIFQPVMPGKLLY